MGTTRVIVIRASRIRVRFLAFVLASVCAVSFGLSRANAQASGDAANDSVSNELATLRAHNKAAVGTQPANEARSVDFTLDGLAGSRRYVRAGDDFEETTQYGPLLRARGSLGGRRWFQNENGQTVFAQADPGQAVKETYTTTVTRTNDPLDAYVVSSLNARGFGTKDFIDAKTWLLVRRESIAASGTSIVTYDDFRTVSGYTTAFHWSIDDGHAENHGDYHITSETIGNVVAADLAIPPTRRALVEFPAGTTSVVLPAHESHDQFIVRLDIGGRGYDFMLDTGASGIVIDDDVATALGLPSYGATSNGANAGRYIGRTVVASAIGVGDLTMRDVVMHTIPHVGVERTTDEYRVVGLLGFDFINAVSLALDYDAGKVTATRVDAFAPPTGNDTYLLDVRLGSGTPMTDVHINGSLGERFVLDTGAHGSILIDDYFARRYPEALVDEGQGSGRVAFFSGVGGRFTTQPYQLSSVELGSVRFKDFVAYRVTSTSSYGGNVDGLLGSELLKYFTVFTDYAHGKVYLQTNDFGRAALGSAAFGKS